MNDADIQRMFRQLDLILNLIQETRSAIKLLKQCGNDGADDPLIPNRQLAVKKFIEEHINKGDRSYGKQCYERVRKYR